MSAPEPAAAADGAPVLASPALAAPAPVAPILPAVRAALDGVADRPLAEHVEVYDGAHRTLQDALASLDES